MWVTGCSHVSSNLVSRRSPPPPPGERTSDVLIMSQTPCLLIINLVVIGHCIYGIIISNLHSNCMTNNMKIYLTSWQLYGRANSCNLIGPFGIPKGKAVCDKKVQLEHQMFFRRGGVVVGVNGRARDYIHTCSSSCDFSRLLCLMCSW